MRNLLYVLAVLLVAAWALGFFVYGVGAIIHVLLVIALVSVLIGVIQAQRYK